METMGSEAEMVQQDGRHGSKQISQRSGWMGLADMAFPPLTIDTQAAWLEDEAPTHCTLGPLVSNHSPGMAHDYKQKAPPPAHGNSLES
mmetsp:Transcript_31779/g.51301  ORF Transcript_31779/g.51301 Transcript_31779/m.51301 type:complete len:89 (-) Transcript_31779:464-730(-)